MKKFTDDAPIYLQVRREIERAIIAGELRPDEAIPSLRKFAAEYSLNPITVANALEALVTAGYLYKKRGIGLFVSPTAPQELRQALATEFRENELRSMVIKARDLGVEKREFEEVLKLVYAAKTGEEK